MYKATSLYARNKLTFCLRGQILRGGDVVTITYHNGKVYCGNLHDYHLQGKTFTLNIGNGYRQFVPSKVVSLTTENGVT